MQPDKTALTLVKSNFHTLGTPRNFQLSSDASKLYFTRSAAEDSNVHGLWVLDVVTGAEKLIFDPLADQSTGHMTAEEETQRERLRETSAGVTGYRLSEDGSRLCFTYNGSLWFAGTEDFKPEKFEHVTGAFDPCFNSYGSLLGYVTADGVFAIAADTEASPKQLADNGSNDIYYGRAEFIASEEFDRYRGYWWSPTDSRMVITLVDETKVPKSGPRRYPAAGTNNAEVTLHMFDAGSDARNEIAWDRVHFPYLLNVQWLKQGLYITVQNREQTEIQLLKVSDDFTTETVYKEEDAVWTDVVQPLPTVNDEGSIISTFSKHKRRIAAGGKPVSPEDYHVEDFIGTHHDWVVYVAAVDPKERIVFATDIKSGDTKQLSPAGGLFSGTLNGKGILVAGSTLEQPDKVRLFYTNPSTKPTALTITSHASKPSTIPQPQFFEAGEEKYQASLLTPAGHDGKSPLPVLLDVYGGPHHQEVLMNLTVHLEKQWWADQGFAVLSIDGPGTPGRDAVWERKIHGDLITEVAAAQIEGLQAALQRFPFLDKSRVAARGWSFGGYLSAFLSVLYPEQVHASISGAPVTDWRLYDTHYTERYLGGPKASEAAYDKSSLLEAVRKHKATRPIMLIHGSEDDNVLIENSKKLTAALDAVKCPYKFVPLDGASHFTKQAEQRVELMLAELKFLQDNLKQS